MNGKRKVDKNVVVVEDICEMSPWIKEEAWIKRETWR